MGKIMLVIELLTDWQLYMPDLIRLARTTHSAVHILELATPLGMGLWTSNKPPDDEAYPDAAEPQPMDEQNFDPTELPVDTAAAALETTAFLDSVAHFLRTCGLTVTTAWIPMFDHSRLGEYALSNAVDTVALIRHSCWATLFEGDDRPGLLKAGMRVIYLEQSPSNQPDSTAVSVPRQPSVG